MAAKYGAVIHLNSGQDLQVIQQAITALGAIEGLGFEIAVHKQDGFTGPKEEINSNTGEPVKPAKKDILEQARENFANMNTWEEKELV